MTITPWSDAARALVGAAFGNPEMRAKEEEMQLKRDQFGLEQKKYGLDEQRLDLDEKKYGLDEAYNPARIGQAEASAGFDRARTATEAITRAKSQIELDNILKFLEPDAPAPTTEFNPFNVGPQGQGNNPAMVLPYDQIQPLDTMPAVSDAEFANYDVRALPPGPEVPFNPMTMGGDAPVMEGPDPFAQLIAGLTGTPTRAVPPNGAAYFEDLGPQQAEPMRIDVPAMAPPAPTDIMTPEIRQMIAAGYLKPENIGDMILAAEGQGANRGVADPQKRIQNAAAGTGTFLSPDQILAQALGATRDTATLGDLAETNLGTADIQNFNYGQQNPAFTEYLAQKDAGPNFTVTNPDGTTVTYGKQGGKPLTEVQGKYALFGTRAAQAQQNLESVLSSDYGRDMGELGFTNSVDFITGMSKPESASGALVNNAIMSPEGRQLYQSANSFLTAIVRPDSGAALTPDEWQIYGKIFIPMPGDDDATVAQKRLDRQIATTALQGLSSGGAAQVAQLLQNKGVPVPKELQVYLNQAPAAAQPAPPAGGPIQITGDADYEALAPGTTFIAPDGSQRVKP